jgi:hypothetical protein
MLLHGVPVPEEMQTRDPRAPPVPPPPEPAAPPPAPERRDVERNDAANYWQRNPYPAAVRGQQVLACSFSSQSC